MTSVAFVGHDYYSYMVNTHELFAPYMTINILVRSRGQRFAVFRSRVNILIQLRCNQIKYMYQISHLSLHLAITDKPCQIGVHGGNFVDGL